MLLLNVRMFAFIRLIVSIITAELDCIRAVAIKPTIRLFDVVTGKANKEMEYISIFPATHFVTDKDKLQKSIKRIKEELKEQVNMFNSTSRPLEELNKELTMILKC